MISVIAWIKYSGIIDILSVDYMEKCIIYRDTGPPQGNQQRPIALWRELCLLSFLIVINIFVSIY